MRIAILACAVALTAALAGAAQARCKDARCLAGQTPDGCTKVPGYQQTIVTEADIRPLVGDPTSIYLACSRFNAVPLESCDAEIAKLDGNRSGLAYAHFLRSFLHQSAGGPDNAIADLNRALEIRPDFVDVLKWRAEAHTAKGNVKAGQQDKAKYLEAIDAEFDRKFVCTGPGEKPRA